jgi:hypothetical protein
MHDTLTQLYKFITKMMLLLESDLENIPTDDKELKLKKNITSIFSRLVNILLQLNKLSKEERLNLADMVADEDLKIIERFMENYKKSSLSADTSPLQ